MTDLVSHIRESIKKSNTVFVCGNGGSASTAEHFTNDLFSKRIKAVCLNSNVSIMTMIANDYGYEHIFSRQLIIYADATDLLIVFSCSGKSLNIINAQITARYIGMEMVGIVGKDNETYQETENRHLALAHEISDGL